MKCPECKNELRCGCKSCRRNHGDLPGMMKWHDCGEIEECPFCGLAAHSDFWLDQEYIAIKEKEENNVV